LAKGETRVPHGVRGPRVQGNPSDGCFRSWVGGGGRELCLFGWHPGAGRGTGADQGTSTGPWAQKGPGPGGPSVEADRGAQRAAHGWILAVAVALGTPCPGLGPGRPDSPSPDRRHRHRASPSSPCCCFNAGPGADAAGAGTRSAVPSGERRRRRPKHHGVVGAAVGQTSCGAPARARSGRAPCSSVWVAAEPGARSGCRRTALPGPPALTSSTRSRVQGQEGVEAKLPGPASGTGRP